MNALSPLLLRLTAALAPLGALACVVTNAPPEARPVIHVTPYDRPPVVQLWMDSHQTLERGDRPRVTVSTDHNAYVTVVRIDTDGYMSVIWPRSAYDENIVVGGRSFTVHQPGVGSFMVDDRPGLGYVFAIASWSPHDLRRAHTGGGMNRPASRVVRGDPYMAVRDLANDIIVDRRERYAMDFAEYAVGRTQYAYPRFICYDCHTGRARGWDPYDYTCLTFRVIVYDDPYYYPYRYRRGTHVVYTQPRYEFKRRSPGERVTAANFIEYRRRDGRTVDRRDVGDDMRERPQRPGNATPDPRRPGDDDDRDRPGRRRGHEADGPGNSNDAPGRANRKPADDRSGNGTPPSRPDRPGHDDAPARPANPPGHANRPDEPPGKSRKDERQPERGQEREQTPPPRRADDDAQAERPGRRPAAVPVPREDVEREPARGGRQDDAPGRSSAEERVRPEPRPEPREKPREEQREEPRAPREEPRPAPREEPRPAREARPDGPEPKREESRPERKPEKPESKPKRDSKPAEETPRREP